VLSGLKRDKLVTSLKGRRGAWKLTPEGRAKSEELATDMDLAALEAEAAAPSIALLGDTPHPVIPPHLAPPQLIGPLRGFLDDYPFDTNVFGMTRFPAKADKGKLDPIAPALEAAADACEKHGFTFHLASDRQIVDEVWTNVTAHMWCCRYGIAFFEERTPRGLNYNLTIEVGGCLVAGRRLALLKDKPVKKLPSDLVGHIYKEVDLEDPDTVTKQLNSWFESDLKKD